MKLSFVEVAGFRGFREKTRFELPGGFVVLSGRNGAGKSTVLDAIDFALTGSINKYAVTEAKGGGLGEHIWWIGEGTPESHYVKVGFIDDDGKPFEIQRNRERGATPSIGEIEGRLCALSAQSTSWAETLMRTTLIRDETIAALSLDLPEQARFAAVRAAIGSLTGPDYSDRTAALVRAADAAKKDQEKRLADFQAELGRALSGLTEARSLADRQSDVAQAELVVSSVLGGVQGTTTDRTEHIRRHVAERKRSVADLSSAMASAERLQPERLYFESPAWFAEVGHAERDRAVAQTELDSARQSLAQLEALAASDRDVNSFASHLMALLEHGEALGLQHGHCPLCAADRDDSQFHEAIAMARAQLSTIGERARERNEALRAAREAVLRAEEKLAAAQKRIAELEARRQKLDEEADEINRIFTRWQLKGSMADLESARKEFHDRQEQTVRLEQALFLLEASGAHDRVTSLESRVDELRKVVDEEAARLSAAERAAQSARQIESDAKAVTNQILTEQFDTVMPLLKELYRRLRPHADWREIETDFGGRVRASLNFTVGDGWNPQFIFSSGQRRAAGIAFLLAMHLSRPWCRLKSLLLDDPVQHVDDYRALNLVEVLSAIRRTGRQVIVAVEDSALADVLCRRLRSTALEPGRRFDIATGGSGSAVIERQTDILPLPRRMLTVA